MVYKLFAFALIFSAVCVHGGSISPRIAGGNAIDESNVNTYNYVVSVKTELLKCTGVVLDGKYVLVPAHCFDGVGNSSTLSQGEFGLKATIVHKHPNYKEKSFDNDVAIIELDGSIPLSETLNEIEVDTGVPEESTKCTVSGYGKTSLATDAGSSATFLDVIIKKNDTCEANDGQICAGVDSTEKTKSLCEGDDGAPLVCNGKVSAIAIKSDKCAATNSDLFMTLKDVRPWIYSIVPNSAVSVVISPLVLIPTLLTIFKIFSLH